MDLLGDDGDDQRKQSLEKAREDLIQEVMEGIY